MFVKISVKIRGILCRNGSVGNMTSFPKVTVTRLSLFHGFYWWCSAALCCQCSKEYNYTFDIIHFDTINYVKNVCVYVCIYIYRSITQYLYTHTYLSQLYFTLSFTVSFANEFLFSVKDHLASLLLSATSRSVTLSFCFVCFVTDKNLIKSGSFFSWKSCTVFLSFLQTQTHYITL